MTEPMPIATDAFPDAVTVTADLSSLGLDPKKKYEVTLSIDGNAGTQTAVYKEIIQGPVEPDPNTLMVVRHKESPHAFLIQRHASSNWQAGMTIFNTWQDLLANFEPERWTYYNIVEAV